MNPGDSATRQEVCLGGPPTATRWGGYHLAQPGGLRGRKASSICKIKPQTSNLPPAPQRATPARKGARCGTGAGFPRPHRPHPEHTGRGTPAARPRGRVAGGGTAPDTRRPPQQRQANPPGDGPSPPPRHAAPTGHAGQGDSVGSPQPHACAHSTWVVDPNSPPSWPAVGGGGRLASDAPRNSGRHPRGDALPPPSRRATPARRGARCGAAAGSPRPHRPHLAHMGRGTPATCPRGRAAGGGTASDTRRPSQLWKATPPPRGRPPTTPAARSSYRAYRPRRQCRALTSAHPRPQHVGGGPNGPPRRQATGGGTAPDTRRPSQRWRATPPDPPRGGRTAPGQVGGNRDRTAPPQARQTEQGTGAGHAEGHGPHGTALPAPSAGTARGAHATSPKGGGSGRCGSASAHTRRGHAGTTRRATGLSSRNAQTAWNCVAASKGKGHPDETARHTQRGTRGAGRGKRERHNTRYRPEPTRTGHCTRQGSSGALHHPPTPRLGSLRASPRCPTAYKPVARARRRRRPGRPRIRGATLWVRPGSGETGKPGRDGAPCPVNPGDSATRQEVLLGGPPTRTRWGGYHLAQPGGPPGPKGV